VLLDADYNELNTYVDSNKLPCRVDEEESLIQYTGLIRDCENVKCSDESNM
jgi:hypothetical protein